MMTISDMNPTVHFSGSLNSGNIQGLFVAIHETTGLHFGYMPREIVGTQFISAILTLCGKKKLSKIHRQVVDAAIRAWAIGIGLGNPRISWPNCY